jgi:hypothetical protein
MKSTKLLIKKESGMQINTKSIDEVSKLKRLHDILYVRIPAGLKNSARVLWAFTFFIVIAPAMVLAEKAWYPQDVDVWNPPFNGQRQRDQKVYTPLNKAQQKWRVGVFIPHLKDAYWLGVNYGLIDEARRLGISLSIYEAGGYGRLEIQRRQIKDSLKEKPDGLIIGAISLDGLNDIVKKASDKGDSGAGFDQRPVITGYCRPSGGIFLGYGQSGRSFPAAFTNGWGAAHESRLVSRAQRRRMGGGR